MMERKVDLISEDPDLVIFRIRPRQYEDAYGSHTFHTTTEHGGRTAYLRLIGKHVDPHRVLYGSLCFFMPSFKPDIIHGEDEPDSLAALQILSARRLFAPRAKLILHTWQNINRRKGPLVKWVTERALRASDAILCSSSEGVTVLRDMGFERTVDVIPPEGIDIDWFRPPAVKQRQESFTILYAGRFVYEKGLDTLLRAIGMIKKPVFLILVGDGPLKDSLFELAKTLRVDHQVQFLAPLTQDKMPELYAMADALVLPSRETPVWKEQYGRVLLEAMACKVPVIGSDSGAIPEVIGDGGMIFKEDDPSSLAKCIDELVENEDMYKNLVEIGYKRAITLFSQNTIASRTKEFYRRVMAECKLEKRSVR